MKKHIIVSFVLGAAVILFASPASQAVPPGGGFAQSERQVVETTELNTVPGIEAEPKKEEIEAKRQAIESKIAEKKAAIAEKLSGPRGESCEKREATINTIIDNRIQVAERHFDTFKTIQNKLSAFVLEKNLSVDNAKALSIVMSDSAAAAQAAINVAKNAEFTCEDAPALAPGSIVKEQFATVKQTLKDYRTAIKEYAAAVKNAADPGGAETGTTPEEPAQ